MGRIFVERRAASLGEGDAFRHVFDLLEGAGGRERGECAPPVDVVEHADRVEITMDVPGISLEVLRVIYARGTVVISGRKLPRVCSESVAFHLAERTFGRFARAIGLSGAFDAGRATASLIAGELRIMLPRIEERRGGDIHVEVTAG